MDEHHPLATPDAAKEIFASWSRHWDLSKPYLAEKSPPTLVRTRFFQALFPHATFLVIMRHPLAVSLATQKWSQTDLRSLLHHWLVCHRKYRLDQSRLNKVAELKYEDFVSAPGTKLLEILEFLGLQPAQVMFPIVGTNEHYRDVWNRLRHSPESAQSCRELIREFEDDVRDFGYSLEDY